MALGVARAALPVAVLLFFAAVLLDRVGVGPGSFVLLLPAGVFITARGALMLLRPSDVLRPLAERERRSLAGRLRLRQETPFGALMALLVGLGWCAGGILIALIEL